MTLTDDHTDERLISMRSALPLPKLYAMFVAACLLVVASIQPASAHAHLTASEPANNATLAKVPERISLTFSEPVEPSFSAITIIAPDKSKTTSQTLTHGKDNNGQMLDAPVSLKAGPGTYTVEWRALSADGHKIKGSYTFSIAP